MNLVWLYTIQNFPIKDIKKEGGAGNDKKCTKSKNSYIFTLSARPTHTAHTKKDGDYPIKETWFVTIPYLDLNT